MLDHSAMGRINQSRKGAEVVRTVAWEWVVGKLSGEGEI